MSNPGGLAITEAFLDQSPACNWIAGPGAVFHRVYGDPVPVFGRSAAELRGRAAADVLEPAPAKLWQCRFSRALEGETLSLRERCGGVPWYLTVFPIRMDGAIRYAGGTAREATAWSAAEHELRNTVMSALKTQEFMRSTASHFLHDSVGQNLTALGLQLDLIRMDIESVAPETSARVVEIQHIIESMMEDVREYSYELNPSTVERAGLRSALDRLTGRVRARFAGAFRVNVDPSLKIETPVASAMYSIAQEAVDNAVQHAACSAIEIAIKSTRSGTSLEIRDNGKGFDPSDILGGRRGLGLLSMEHYAAQAGLTLSVKSNRETGTIVRAATLEDA